MKKKEEIETVPEVKTYPSSPDENGYFFETAKDEAEDNKSRLYPTKPDADGWFFSDKQDELFELETKEYPNKNKVMRGTLKNGVKFITRSLKFSEGALIEKMAGRNVDLRPAVMAHFSTSFNGKTEPVEWIQELGYKDFQMLTYANGILNFL